MQELELIHVKKCAKEITGSDKPRKLPPAQAKAVNECAKKFMPPTHTKALLEAAAKKILQAHHQKADKASVHKLMAAHAKKPANSKVLCSNDDVRVPAFCLCSLTFLVAALLRFHPQAAAKARLNKKALAKKVSVPPFA